MAYGIETWDDNGQKVLTTFQPYNLVGSVNLVLGNQTFAAPDSTGSVEYWVEYNHPLATSSLGLQVDSISLSNGVIYYTVSDGGFGGIANKGRVFFAIRR